MPTGLIAAGIGLQAIGMLTGFLGAKKAESAAKRAAREEAVAEGKVTAERIRQLNVSEGVTRGETIAATAASGVKVGQDSPLMLLANQASEFAHERRITQEVGATKAASALQRGRDVGNAVRYQSYSNLASGASNIFSILNSQGAKSDGKDPFAGIL
jgi:hypothetical protein